MKKFKPQNLPTIIESEAYDVSVYSEGKFIEIGKTVSVDLPEVRFWPHETGEIEAGGQTVKYAMADNQIYEIRVNLLSFETKIIKPGEPFFAYFEGKILKSRAKDQREKALAEAKFKLSQHLKAATERGKAK